MNHGKCHVRRKNKYCNIILMGKSGDRARGRPGLKACSSTGLNKEVQSPIFAGWLIGPWAWGTFCQVYVQFYLCVQCFQRILEFWIEFNVKQVSTSQSENVFPTLFVWCRFLDVCRTWSLGILYQKYFLDNEANDITCYLLFCMMLLYRLCKIFTELGSHR